MSVIDAIEIVYANSIAACLIDKLRDEIALRYRHGIHVLNHWCALKISGHMILSLYGEYKIVLRTVNYSMGRTRRRLLGKTYNTVRVEGETSRVSSFIIPIKYFNMKDGLLNNHVYFVKDAVISSVARLADARSVRLFIQFCIQTIVRTHLLMWRRSSAIHNSLSISRSLMLLHFNNSMGAT